MSNAETKNYTLGRGDLFFAKRRADGTLGGERLIGNTPAFGLTVSTQTVKHYSSARGMKTQDREVPTQTDRSAKFTTDDVNPKNLAMLFLGEASTIAVTSASSLTETFTDVEPGLTYQVGISDAHPAGLQNLTITAVKIGSTAQVLGTDYTKDAALGRIYIIEGGAIDEGDDIIVEYGRTAYNQEQVVSGSTVVDGALRFIAYNPEGDDIDYYLGDVKLYPDGDFAVKADTDWQTQSFNVAVQEPDNGRPAITANGRAFA